MALTWMNIIHMGTNLLNFADPFLSYSLGNKVWTHRAQIQRFMLARKCSEAVN